MSKGFTDWTDLGIFPLQDVEEGVPVGVRKVVAGARVLKSPDPGTASVRRPTIAREGTLGTIGDVHPWVFWQTAEREKRAMGSWSQAFGAIVVEGGDGGGRYKVEDSELEPLTVNADNEPVNDVRYRAVTPPWPKCLPTQPKGSLGIMVGNTTEETPGSLLFRADPRLVAPGAGGPGDAGTLVVDCQPTGELCMDGSETPGKGGRAARLQSLVRVIALNEKSAADAGGAPLNALAINYGVSEQDGIAGHGMIYGPGKSTAGQPGPPTTGPRNYSSASGSRETSRSGGFGSGRGAAGAGKAGAGKSDEPTPVCDFGEFKPKARRGYAVGFMSDSMSGPIVHGCTKHRLGVDADGHPMTSAHNSIFAYFYKDNHRDGPLFFENDFPENVKEHKIKTHVHLSFDASLPHPFVKGRRMGMWRWWTTVPYVKPTKTPNGETGPPDPGPPTPGPPTPGPPTPRTPSPGNPTTPGPRKPDVGPPTTGGRGDRIPIRPGPGPGKSAPITPPRKPPKYQPQPPSTPPPSTIPITPGGGPRIGPPVPLPPPPPITAPRGPGGGGPFTGGPLPPGPPPPPISEDIDRKNREGSQPLGSDPKFLRRPGRGGLTQRPQLELEPLGDWRYDDDRSNTEVAVGVINKVGGSKRGADVGLFTIFHPYNNSFSAVSFRPQLWIKGAPNFEHNPELSQRMLEADELVRPTVLTMRAFAAQTNSGDFDYTTKPEHARARGGQANGGVVFGPPEFEMEDYLQINSQANVDSPETSSFVAVTPKVAVGFGKPTTTGTLSSGAKLIHQDNVGGVLTFSETTDDNDTRTTLITTGIFDGQPFTDFKGVSSIRIPAGTTAQRPSTSSDGELRYNTTLNALEVYDSGWASVGGGASVFTSLTDTPSTYVGQALKYVRVNAGETALEFQTFPTIPVNWVDLGDTSASVGSAGDVVTNQAGTLTPETPTSVWTGTPNELVRTDGSGYLDNFVNFPVIPNVFTDLSDTPANYTGHSLKVVRVNAGETALEFETLDWVDLNDTPGSFTALKIPTVNSGGTALEFSGLAVKSTGELDGNGKKAENFIAGVGAGDLIEAVQFLSGLAAYMPLTGGTFTGAVTHSSGDVTLNDNIKHSYGTAGAEGDIYSNGTDLIIDPLGTADLRILGDCRIEGKLGVDVDPGSVNKVEIEDNAHGGSVIFKVTSDDDAPWGLVVGNDTFSTTDTDGFTVYVNNGGKAFVDARGTGAELSFSTSGSEALVIENDGEMYAGNTLAVGKTSTVVASAVLECSSTTAGFLPPRMTTTQRNAITSPATGLLIYNTSTDELQFYHSSSGWLTV